MHNPAMALLTHLLPSYLVFITVLTPVEKSLNRVHALGLEAGLPKVGPFWTAWSAFKLRVEELYKLKTSSMSLKLGGCNNVKVSSHSFR